MGKEINYKIHRKERMYFAIKIIISLIVYGLLIYFLFMSNTNSKVTSMIFFYIIAIGLTLLFTMGLLVGNLKGNAIKISQQQFPDIYEIASRQSSILGLKKTPDIYLLQAGGVLNAFATRFLGRNYVVLYSDILDEAYENNKETVEFIIGHELGHIKRNHITKQMLLFPSIIFPFLNSAYSCACEYTCDSIGASLSPKGVRTGLLLLASGKKLYNKVNVEKFIEQKNTENGFWSWLAEKLSSHPKLTKRIAVYQQPEFISNPIMKTKVLSESQVEDHNKYMPNS